jgi:hypothetical protein
MRMGGEVDIPHVFLKKLYEQFVEFRSSTQPTCPPFFCCQRNPTSK